MNPIETHGLSNLPALAQSFGTVCQGTPRPQLPTYRDALRLVEQSMRQAAKEFLNGGGKGHGSAARWRTHQLEALARKEKADDAAFKKSVRKLI